jgi:4-amino-4-deoxy-L-arabinose transferase-like glycosyltransferase
VASTSAPETPADGRDDSTMDAPATHGHAPPSTFWRWTIAIAAIGLAIRLTHLFAFDHDPIGGDGFGYVRAAQLARDGAWFTNPVTGGPSAGHPPLWTLLLSVLAVLGVDEQIGIQVFASLLGTATIVVVALAGRRLGGARVGLVAAAIAAVYPGFWIYERTVLSETLLLLVVAALVIAIYRFLERPTTLGVVELAALTAVAALTRSEQLLLAIVVIVPVVLSRRSRPWTVRIGWLALAGVVTALLVSTWTIYNRDRFPAPVLLSDQSATVLTIGNCEQAYYGPTTGSYDDTCIIEVAMRKLDYVAAQEYARERAITYARENVGRLPVVVVARIGRTFGFWAPFQQTDLEWQIYNLGPVVPRAGLIMYWLLVPAAVAGAVRSRRLGTPIYPLVGMIGVVLITTVVTLGMSRYRAAAEVPIVLLAAVALAALSERWTGRRSQRRT